MKALLIGFRMTQLNFIHDERQKIPQNSIKTVRYFRSCQKSKRFSTGFSFPELLVVVAMIGVFAAFALPTLSESIQNSRVKELSSNLSVSLFLAQSEAVKRGVQISIGSQQNTGNEWKKGWDVFVDLNRNGVMDAGEELLSSYNIEDNGVTLTSKDSVFSSWIAFLPSGAAKGNGGISGSFWVCRADQDSVNSRTITVQASGNIHIEKGALACSPSP